MGAAERKLATVLFADLVGSTALGEHEDPERTRVLLERFYDAMADEITIAGGTIEKFAGDAVMAVFGVPEALEDHAERALHAALAMHERLQAVFDGKLELRIGVNTGEIVAGQARAGSSFVTGDAVNVAARLEQAATPGTTVVGARTAEAVRGAFELGPVFGIDAKGKSEPVMAQTLVRALTLMRPRGLRGGARAFVGRGTELELLQAIFRHAVEQSEPHVVTLMGDAGVGKTTLVQELWRWLEDQDTAARSTDRPVSRLRSPHLLGARGDPSRAPGNPRERVAGRGAPAARRPGDARPGARPRPHRRRAPARRARQLPGGLGRVPERADR